MVSIITSTTSTTTSTTTSPSRIVQRIAGLHLANQLIRSELNQPARGEIMLSIFVRSLIDNSLYLGFMVRAGPRQDMMERMRPSFRIIFSVKLWPSGGGSEPQTYFRSDGRTWLTDCVTRARSFNFYFLWLTSKSTTLLLTLRYLKWDNTQYNDIFFSAKLKLIIFSFFYSVPSDVGSDQYFWLNEKERSGGDAKL